MESDLRNLECYCCKKSLDENSPGSINLESVYFRYPQLKKVHVCSYVCAMKTFYSISPHVEPLIHLDYHRSNGYDAEPLQVDTASYLPPLDLKINEDTDVSNLIDSNFQALLRQKDQELIFKTKRLVSKNAKTTTLIKSKSSIKSSCFDSSK